MWSEEARERLRPLIGGALAAAWFALVALEARGAEPVFARVGETVITQQDYEQAFANAARGKFYHGKPPEAELAKLQREVGDALVDEALLLKEARRRRLQPDAAAVRGQLDALDARYGSSERWQRERAARLPALQRQLEQQSLLERLQAAVRSAGAPAPAAVEAYWRAHPEKFTEPEQLKLSLILLKVDASSPQAKWSGAQEEGAAIVRRLRGGADFAELARLHSGDPSAEKGGDLGYLHRGMLPEPAQAAVDALQPGGISAPIGLLEGIAVFRLDERRAAKPSPFEAVRQRAQDLLERERGDAAWKALVAKLRRETPPRIDESRYLPLAVAAPGVAR